MNFGLSDSLIKKFGTVFSSYPEIEEVWIFGSRAKNTHYAGSDIDLSMKGENLDTFIQNRVWLDLDALNTPFLIDLNIFNNLTSAELKSHIERVGKILYKSSTVAD